MFRLRSEECWFDCIAKGNKLVEARLPLYNLKEGNIIEFYYNSRTIRKQVKYVRDYSCFAELLDVEGLTNVLPGITSLEEGVNIFKAWYPLDMQRKKGVIAIGLEHGEIKKHIRKKPLVPEPGTLTMHFPIQKRLRCTISNQ